MVRHETFTVETKGTSDVIDITERVGEAVAASKVMDGLVLVFTPHSTAAVTTIENEPFVLKDLAELLERLLPASARYEHEKAWGETNGFSHLRSSMLGTSLTLPVADGVPVLGPWQQVVLIECDTKGRPRMVRCTVIGE